MRRVSTRVQIVPQLFLSCSSLVSIFFIYCFTSELSVNISTTSCTEKYHFCSFSFHSERTCLLSNNLMLFIIKFSKMCGMKTVEVFYTVHVGSSTIRNFMSTKYLLINVRTETNGINANWLSRQYKWTDGQRDEYLRSCNTPSHISSTVRLSNDL